MDLLLGQALPADQALGPFSPYANLTAVLALIVFLGGILFRAFPQAVNLILTWMGKRDELHAKTLEAFTLSLAHIVDRMETQRQLDRETTSRQVAGLHQAIDTNAARNREAIDDLGTEIRNYANGRDRTKGG